MPDWSWEWSNAYIDFLVPINPRKTKKTKAKKKSTGQHKKTARKVARSRRKK